MPGSYVQSAGPAPGAGRDSAAAPSSAASALRSPTQQAIERAATTLFLRDGFAATTVRSIAAEAGVNPALIIRHFGSKESLFLRVVAPMPAPGADRQVSEPDVRDGSRRTRLSDAFQTPTAQLGAALTAYVVDEAQVEGSQAKEAYLALSRALDIADVRERLHEVIDVQIVQPLAARFREPGARARAGVLAAALSGLMGALWDTEDALLKAVGREELIALYGNALQVIIDVAAAPAESD